MFSALTDKIAFHRKFIQGLSVNPRFWYILAMDIALIILAYYLAHLVRFEDGLRVAHLKQFVSLLPLLLIIKLPVFCFFGLYRGMWIYTGMVDLLNITKATLLSTIILISLLLYTNRFEGFSRSVFFLDTLVTFLLICGHRVSILFLLQVIRSQKTVCYRT